MLDLISNSSLSSANIASDLVAVYLVVNKYKDTRWSYSPLNICYVFSLLVHSFTWLWVLLFLFLAWVFFDMWRRKAFYYCYNVCFHFCVLCFLFDCFLHVVHIVFWLDGAFVVGKNNTQCPSALLYSSLEPQPTIGLKYPCTHHSNSSSKILM